MKNYFARLVARAVPPRDSTPVVRESTKVHDPFKQVAPHVLPVPFAATARETTSTPLTTTNSVAHERAAEKRVLPPVQPAPPTTTVDSGKLSQSELSASPTQAQAGESRGLVASKRFEPVETMPIRKPFDETQIKAERPPPELKPAETHGPGLSGRHGSDQHVADAEREQAILLRKADAFMTELFEERARFQSGRDLEEESGSHQTESLRPLSQPIENPRLKPAQATETTREPDQQQPSLIIGKLTVEVTPPTSPSAPIQPQRIVVRGPKSIQSGVISSRRFGLGQF